MSSYRIRDYYAPPPPPPLPTHRVHARKSGEPIHVYEVQAKTRIEAIGAVLRHGYARAVCVIDGGRLTQVSQG